jgi:microcompartment protein CcmK/EutM
MDSRGALAAGIGVGEQVALSSQGHGARCEFRTVVVDLDEDIVSIADWHITPPRC